MEITPHSLSILHGRLIDVLRARVRNGEISERSLARMTGISQPHIHNVLKGVRTLSPGLCDAVLGHMRMSVLDLFRREELIDQLSRTSTHRESRLHPVPVLNGQLGLENPIPIKGPTREVHAVPAHLTAAATDPLVASLAADPEMEPLFGDRDLVLLDQSEAARTFFQSEGYYIVRTPRGPCVRALRRSGDLLLLVTERNRENPGSWESIPISSENILDVILARVVWLNRRRRWEDHVA